jgi:hypothetical protein
LGDLGDAIFDTEADYRSGQAGQNAFMANGWFPVCELPINGNRHHLISECLVDLYVSCAKGGNQNALKHGRHTRDAIEERRKIRTVLRDTRRVIQELDRFPAASHRYKNDSEYSDRKASLGLV